MMTIIYILFLVVMLIFNGKQTLHRFLENKPTKRKISKEEKRNTLLFQILI